MLISIISLTFRQAAESPASFPDYFLSMRCNIERHFWLRVADAGACFCTPAVMPQSFSISSPSLRRREVSIDWFDFIFVWCGSVVAKIIVVRLISSFDWLFSSFSRLISISWCWYCVVFLIFSMLWKILLMRLIFIIFFIDYKDFRLIFSS